ncbi:FMN-dependent NADH-azoreductase [Algimonas arctica]|uniref:FMN dependent NADH:quinone oxidoreductase n=1 Tax=Algimonas arctica TaxID=1479486 RepID=A0A8J3CMU0_9PROT|nr:NAD(P)H-dependent oxidoreductase [Algimonas arctica]GHA81289.1 FMN-dependent NADH-azoreductase [Algimonas arctica]
MPNPLNILRIDSSARRDGSVSRSLADLYIDSVAETRPVRVQTRDVSHALPVIQQDWIGATFTPEPNRTADHRAALARSDQLVEELEGSELIVISTPIYNFGIPASLKLWVDQVARAGRTFHYTENGPEGLLSGKRAVILVASGGTQVGSDIDFATPYLRHFLGFLGITDVQIIAADQLMANGPDKVEQTKQQIRTLAA